MSDRPDDPRIAALRDEAAEAIRAATTLEAVEALRLAWLGKSGRLQDVLRGIGALPPAERGPAGKAANEAKGAIEALLAARLETLRTAREASLGDTEWVDATQAAATTRVARGLRHRELDDAVLRHPRPLERLRRQDPEIRLQERHPAVRQARARRVLHSRRRIKPRRQRMDPPARRARTPPSTRRKRQEPYESQAMIHPARHETSNTRARYGPRHNEATDRF